MTLKNIILLIITIFANLNLFSQTPNPLIKVLQSDIPIIKKVINNSDSYELQIIYTAIDRDENNYPIFTDHNYNVDTTVYFYPASTVKLPASVLALEKINEAKINGLNKFTSLEIDSAFDDQKKVTSDESSEDGFPSIAHYIKKILLVSDNDAFNRLYEFLGQQQINERLQRKGFSNFKLLHRLAFGYTAEGNANTNPFTFFKNSDILYEQPAHSSNKLFDLKLKKTSRGKGYIDSNGKLISEPMDFSSKNYLALPTLHKVIKRIMFPYAYPHEKQFNLTNNDYCFLYKYMSAFPDEVNFPKYDSTYYDSYVKFFMFGDSNNSIPKHIRVLNKVGFAYGFITDAAYIVDFKNKIEFMVSATLHVNKNEIYNDGIYEYDKIGIPFLAELGKQLYNYELEREREFEPDLKRFEVQFINQRDD
jgi:hypothetical protein